MDYPRRLPPQAEPKVTRSRFPRGRRHPGAGAFLPSRGPARPSRRPDPRVLPTCCGRSGCRGGRAALPETDALRSPRRGPALHSRGQRRSWERVINRLRGCGAGRSLRARCGRMRSCPPGGSITQASGQHSAATPRVLDGKPRTAALPSGRPGPTTAAPPATFSIRAASCWLWHCRQHTSEGWGCGPRSVIRGRATKGYSSFDFF
ncbi:uncharacterized protein LOC116481766 isoform X5 [Hylobates moloch]|uniref:uncharacterized protein LOC116481766 isoform X5 n=1 Tax=Hylobates moloch TaxID=81572 RepID=UPI0026763AE0|nr:uncharacterized protein LOC116481766 isoform X5 [Hylobates moloch]